MFLHRRLTGLSLALLLLVMQAFWLAHRLEHDLSPGGHEETACEFCIAMHGMGAAATGLERAAVFIPSDAFRPGYAPIARCDAESIQPRQQGPPGFS